MDVRQGNGGKPVIRSGVSRRPQASRPKPTTKALPPLHKLLILEDRNLLGMLNRADIVSEFPFFKELGVARSKARAGCGCGSRTPNTPQLAAALVSVKKSLAGLSAERQARFKHLLKAMRVQVKFVENRQMRRVEF